MAIELRWSARFFYYGTKPYWWWSYSFSGTAGGAVM